MARVIPISNNAFPCTLNPTGRNRYRHCHLAPLHASTDDGSGETANKSSDETTSSSAADPDFERRIAQLTYRKGKKAELRRLKKAGVPPSLASAYLKSGKTPVMLPPVPLQDPTSVSGVPVKVGFSPYSERINGYLAGLGSTALLLVELGSGQSVVKYHSLGIVFLQIYTAAALAAVFIKYEKEKISVWPKSRPPDTATATDK